MLLNDEQKEDEQRDPLSSELNENIDVLRRVYEDCLDTIFRPFSIGGKIDAWLIYIEGLSNIEEIDSSVLAPLMQETNAAELETTSNLLQKKLFVSKATPVMTIADCIHFISSGSPVLLIDQLNEGFALGLSKWEKRSIEEPTAEFNVRGPREGFTESIGVNISMMRRRLRSPDFKMKSMTIGRHTMTEVVIGYIDGIVDKTLVEEVISRLRKIDIDGILESGYIEQLIEDNPYSPFPQIQNTERPDVCAASLLEGRVAIFVDGTPFVLIAPTTLFSLFQSSEDYYIRSIMGTGLRLLRYFFILVSLLLPSIYVAVITYHQEMVPTTLLLSMATSRERVPLPAFFEALLMEIIFEALREAGIRIPKQIGAAVSIVGGLVIGQAAVEAGLVSAPMVMVVSITGIASFTIPRYSAGIAVRMLRFPIIFLAGTLGLLGVMLGFILILAHLCSLRSFGVPYLTPLAPMQANDMKDVLIRAPIWMLNTRPHLTGGEYNKFRQSPGQKPNPSKENENE